MKPIETPYAGCRFRSRLEARWAVFLDTVEVGWEYEAEGLDLDGVHYLPDFWLPRLRVWLEVKGPGGDETKWRRLHEQVNRSLPLGLQVPYDEIDLPTPRRHNTPMPARTFLAHGIPDPTDPNPGATASMVGPGSPHYGWAWGRCHLCGQIEIGHVAWPVLLGCGHTDQIDDRDPAVLDGYRAARSHRFGT